MHELIKALIILSEYSAPAQPTHCEHDLLYVAVPPGLVSPADLTRLQELHFIPDNEGSGFISSYFGSC